MSTPGGEDKWGPGPHEAYNVLSAGGCQWRKVSGRPEQSGLELPGRGDLFFSLVNSQTRKKISPLRFEEAGN